MKIHPEEGASVHIIWALHITALLEVDNISLSAIGHFLICQYIKATAKIMIFRNLIPEGPVSLTLWNLKFYLNELKKYVDDSLVPNYSKLTVSNLSLSLLNIYNDEK